MAATSKAARLLRGGRFQRVDREASNYILSCFGYVGGGALPPRGRVLRIVLLLLLVTHYAGQQWRLASRYFHQNSDDRNIRDSLRTATNATHVPGNSDQQHATNDRPRHDERLPNLLKIVYVGEFGLGHRLSKMSAAYHLISSMMMVTEHPRQRREDRASGRKGVRPDRDIDIDGLVLEASWGTCDWPNGTKVDIFASLFGPDPLLTSLSDNRTSSSASPQRRHPLESAVTYPTPTILIRNDVKGYYAGQMYKNAQTKLTPELLKAWDDKMRSSDLQLFHQLLNRFQFRHEAVKYQRDHDWDSHFVVGIHFRLGNGEQDHFAASRRTVTNAQRLVDQTIQLVLQYRDDALRISNVTSMGPSHDKPWAIIVASDTPAVISMVQNALQRFQPIHNSGIHLWASPSLEHLPDRGVSYTLTQADECWEGWKYAMLDQYLLSHVQLLVAPTRSTFTQIVPRAMVLSPQASSPPPPRPSGVDRASTGSGMGGGTFCEIEFDSSRPTCPPRMVCHADSIDWLFRQNGTGRIVRLSTTGEDDTGGSDATASCRMTEDESNTLYVPHKLLVHLPESVHEWEFATNEFRAMLLRRGADTAGTTAVVGRYGERFAQKYRNYASRPEWRLR